MGSWSDRKHGAASGFLAMVLLLVGNFITGQPPRFGAGPVTVLHFYSHHHRAILIGMILTGIAIPLYVWFVAHLATTVGGHLGAAIALGGILVAACAAVGDASMVAGAQLAHSQGEGTVLRGVYMVGTMGYSRLFWAGIAISVPLALAVSRGALTAWAGWIAWLQTVVFFLGGASLKLSGFFSPTGGMAVIGYLVYFIGTALIAVALWRTAHSAATVEGAAASAA